MDDPVITCSGLSKAYRIDDFGRTGFKRVASVLASAGASVLGRGGSEVDLSEGRWIWALEDVDLQVRKGEIVGVIGPNGAGKSTLLKILARLTEPTRGTAEIRGRIGSLLEVGTGFHPDLTGRDNVFLNGAMLGMSLQEIRAKFQEIVDFADIGEFIDAPVKHYSSGMYMRLAFSVAAHLESDILLVDEVLAVGDATFQTKCIKKMEGVARSGRTVVFVSHAHETVARLCTRVVLVEGGRVSADGDPRRVVDTYLSHLHVKLINDMRRDREKRLGRQPLRFTESWVENRHGEPSTIVTSGEGFKLVVRYEADQELPSDLVISAAIMTAEGFFVARLVDDPRELRDAALPQHGRIEWHFPHLALNSGRFVYNLMAMPRAELRSASGGGVGEEDDTVLGTGSFDVEPGDFFGTGQIPATSYMFMMNHVTHVYDAGNGEKVL